MYHRTCSYLFALTLMAAPAAASLAQNAYVSDAGNAIVTQEAAPIERSAPPQDMTVRPDHVIRRPVRIPTSQPARGVTVRSDAPVQTVASDAQHVEIKIDHGRANVMVHDPAENQLILVDLPGGQTQLLKNGFYTFNADTNTIRVFSGEADAFAGNRDKPAHVKGDDQAVFAGGNVAVNYSDPYYSRQDVLPGGYAEAHEDHGGPGYGYAPEPYGYYGAPYGYGWDSPYYAWDYPYYGYGWGYPYYGWGLGFGWGWGGYRGYYGGRGWGGPIHPGGYGGFHGGSVGGFHGGGFGGGHVGGGGHR